LAASKLIYIQGKTVALIDCNDKFKKYNNLPFNDISTIVAICSW